MASAGELPIELISEIQSRLPAKSLIRFKCVSKTWCSMISSPHFIATHLCRSLSNPQHPPSFLFYHFDLRIKRGRFTLHSSDDPFPENHFFKHLNSIFSTPNHFIEQEASTSSAIQNFPNFPLSVNKEIEARVGFFAYQSDFTELHCSHFHDRPTMSVVGSCNGLVCLSGLPFSRESYVVWNPSINKSILLPLPDTPVEHPRHNSHSMGFGYDAKTDDFKLVKFECSDVVFPHAFTAVEVYTLRTGVWRSVMIPVTSHVTVYGYFSIYFNGALHWLVDKHLALFKSVILSFSMEDEIFREIALPRILQDRRVNMKVSVFDGNLAIVPSRRFWQENCNSVWVMKDYGNEESWIKLFDIETDEEFEIEEVIGFGSNNEVLISDDERLFSYNLTSKNKRNLHVRGERNSFYLDRYVESLVLPDQVSRQHGNSDDADQVS